MIWERILYFFLSAFIRLLDSLPDVNVDLDFAVGGFNVIKEILYGVNYFIPFKDVLPILVISASITGFHIAWAIVLRIKSFVPGMGG